MTLTDIDQTRADVQNDYDLLLYLTNDLLKKIYSTKKRINKYSHEISPRAFDHFLQQLGTVEKNLLHLSKELQTTKISKEEIQMEFPKYLIHYDYLKSLVSLTSGIVSALDSQSPSFTSSWYSQAGQYTGKITQSFNDYGRDQHIQGNIYEQAFKKEYIDAPFKFPFHVYATTSGMAALTTIAGFIAGEETSNRPILVGKSCYFEEKFLLKTFFEKRIIEFDEKNITELITIVKSKEPVAIFLDTLSNSSTMVFPDSLTVIKKLREVCKKTCYIVFDNTGLSVTFQPFSRDFFPNTKIRIILWESLLKHHQFGLDKVNGGIIYTNIEKGINLYSYRDHLGTNITDTQALSLPFPNRALLVERLSRHERNILLLSEKLNDALSGQSLKIQAVVYPGIASHSDFHSAHQVPYHGAFVTLAFQSKYAKLSYYQTFMNNVLSLAKKNAVPLIGGTSFGFPITRVYTPASRPGQGTPFIRIAIGSEPLLNFMSVIDVIVTVAKTI